MKIRHQANPKMASPLPILTFLVRSPCQRGRAWYSRGEFERAIADCTAAIRLNPKQPNVYSQRGLAHLMRKEYDKAAADFDATITRDGKNGYAYAMRAALLASHPDAQHRDGKKAVQDVEKARQLIAEPDGYVCEAFAAAYAEAGNFEEAVRWQRRTLQDLLYAGNDDARDRLELYRNKQPYRLP